ncbi:hypothetical protein PPL_01404 [Heterostelium album PN500]|uniref:CST complex subunit CTC1 n=1 Tax=Heterostelium pallidum (strain ATCC 26659 / Pp 5 / PN500) TaxID=670386 RepID=D3AZ64_HETP5|nr:hypothetical protein PPL_01404 [Heterostelium album PN500]EFA85447.1 hypothetical protein PPL_01404 [Heterostelium album PN500]|eukprot:XP_020437556.1 hypothetical protein PPL_01404 [Heterostelium album PN500]
MQKVNKRKISIQSKRELKSSPYVQSILKYLNYCNDEFTSTLSHVGTTSGSVGIKNNNIVVIDDDDDVEDDKHSGGSSPSLPLSQSKLKDDHIVPDGISPFVARWIRHSLAAQYNHLSGLIEPPQIHKSMERLIVYLLGIQIISSNPTNNQSKLIDNGTILTTPNRRKSTSNNNNTTTTTTATTTSTTNAGISSAATNIIKGNENGWCPTKSYFVNVKELMSRTANYASLDQSVPDEMNHNFRLLMGMITSCSNPDNRDRLVLKDRDGEMPVQLSSSSTPVPDMMDSIVFVTSWRLVVVPSSSPSSTNNSTNNIYSSRNVLTLSQIGSSLSTSSTASSTSSLSSSSSSPNKKGRYTIHIKILSKSSILPSRNGQFFFLQALMVSDSSSDKASKQQEQIFYIMFSDDMTKWFQLLDVGNHYLLENITVKLIFSGAPKERILFHVYSDTKIFHTAIAKTNTRITLNSESLQAATKSAQQLPHAIDFVGTITGDFKIDEGSYIMDNGLRVFFTHYACKGFFGSGIRVGTIMKLENVHPIYVNNSLEKLSTVPAVIVLSSVEQFKNGYLYDQIASSFGIKPVAPFHRSEDHYDIFFNHDTQCYYNKQSFQFPGIIEIAQIPQPKNVTKSERYLNNLKYTLIGRFELEPQSYEWGKVYIKDADSSFMICNIIDLNEYHLNYIWKINNYMINLEVYQDELGNEKKLVYLQFSMDDCNMLAPIDVDRHLSANCDRESKEYQEKFDLLQQNAKTFHQLGFLFFKLIGKITRYGKLSLIAILLVEGQPLIKINNVPNKYYPALQISSYYYVDQCSEKLSSSSKRQQQSQQSHKYTQFKTIIFIDSDESRLTPQDATIDLIHDYCIPLVTIQNDDLFDQIDRFEVRSDHYSVRELFELDAMQLYKKDQFNLVTFIAFITKQYIKSKNGKLTLILWCRDPNDSLGKEICVILQDYHYGIVERMVVKFTNLCLTTGGVGTNNFCHSNRYSYYNVLSSENERISADNHSTSSNSPLIAHRITINDQQQQQQQQATTSTTTMKRKSTTTNNNDDYDYDYDDNNNSSDNSDTKTREEAFKLIELFDYDQRKEEVSSPSNEQSSSNSTTSSSSNSPFPFKGFGSDRPIKKQRFNRYGDDDVAATTTTTTTTSASTMTSNSSHNYDGGYDDNLPTYDYSKPLLLADVNRSIPPKTLCRVVADITNIIYVDISYSCSECEQPITSTKCKCKWERQDIANCKFIGSMECEVSDGSSVKSIVVNDEEIIEKILNIPHQHMIKIKSQLIKAKKVGLWAKSEEVLKSMKYSESESIDLVSAKAWKDDQTKFKTYRLTVNKGNTFGNILICHKLELVNSRDQAWSVMDFVNQSFNNMIS